MINFKNETGNTLWWIVKSLDDTIIHYGILEDGSLLQSGQVEFDTYLSEEEWLNELTLLGININED